MLTICSSSQIAFCSLSTGGSLSVSSRVPITAQPLRNALAWDSATNTLLVPTLSALVSIDPTGKKPAGTLKTWKSSPIQALSFAGTKNYLNYCQNNKLVVVEPRGQPRAVIQGDFCSNISAIQASKDHSYIACAGTDFWCMDIAKKSRIVLEGIHNEGISAFCFSSHQNDRLYASDKTDILVYDLSASCFPSKRVAIEDTRISTIAASPTQPNRIALSDDKGRVYVVDTLAENALYKKYTLSTTVTALTWNVNGTILYAGTSRGKLVACDLTNFTKEPEFITIGDENQFIFSAADLPIKLKIGTPKAKNPAPSTHIKRRPLTDGSNVPRSASSPSIKPTAAHSPSPKAKASSFRARISDPTHQTPKRTSLNPGKRDAKAMKRPVQTPKQHSPSPSYTLEARPPPSQSVKSKTLDNINTNTTQCSTPTSLHTSSPSPSLSAGSSRLSIDTPSSPDTIPEPLEAPYRETLSVSPSLPSLDLDDTITVARLPETQTSSFKHPLYLPDGNGTREKPPLNPSRPSLNIKKSINPIRSSMRDTQASLNQAKTRRATESRPNPLNMDDELKDLIQSLRDETRGSILDLHLDLVRMNRDWQAHMQKTLQSCISDFKALKEENERLRDENAWLRSL